jgi:hypothetical protein
MRSGEKDTSSMLLGAGAFADHGFCQNSFLDWASTLDIFKVANDFQ